MQGAHVRRWAASVVVGGRAASGSVHGDPGTCRRRQVQCVGALELFGVGSRAAAGVSCSCRTPSQTERRIRRRWRLRRWRGDERTWRSPIGSKHPRVASRAARGAQAIRSGAIHPHEKEKQRIDTRN